MIEFLYLPFTVARRLSIPTNPGAFRLFLASLVFIHHFSSFAVGAYAVFVFFVLSGYWLQRMWIERYKATKNPYLTYMVSRIWRLAPTMIIVSLITIALLPVIGISVAKIFSSNLFHLVFSSIFLLGYSWMLYLPVGSAWSLDVEMQFYIIAPLISAVLVMPRMRWLIMVTFVLFFLYFTDGMINGTDTHHEHVLKYLAFFVAGMIFARVSWSPSPRLAGLSAAICMATVLLIALSPWRDILFGGATPGPLFTFNLAFNAALTVISLPFAIFTTTQESDTTDRMMADLSYIVYLQHWIAMQWFFTIKGPFMARLAVAVISFIAVPLVSWLIWKYFDKPINRLRSRWVNSRSRF